MEKHFKRGSGTASPTPNLTILGRNGYILKKGHIFPPLFIEELRAELVVSAKDNGYATPKKFRLYAENRKGDLILPRYYALDKLGEPVKTIFKYNPERKFEFAGKLRKEQIPPAKAVLEALNTRGGGILSIATGGGKTALAIYCMYKLQASTIVIVNRVELVKQWKREIGNFLPNARIGEIRGEILDVEEKDVVVAMVNTVSMKKFPDSIFNGFDFLVVDECHTVASEIFHQCMPKIRTPYTLGLSATPERSDGLMNVVMWFMGDIVYKSKDKINSKLDVMVNCIKYKGTREYASELIAFNEKPNIAKMMNLMCDDPSRNKVLLWAIMELYKDPRREILVLADRKKLLKGLKKKLDELGVSCGLFIGEMKSEDYEETKKTRVILGSYQICGTGFNLPKLNSLIMATPRKKVEQMVGRILRKQHEIHPVVVDLWDTFSIFQHMGAARVRFYKSLEKVELHALKFKPDNCPHIKDTKKIKTLLEMCSKIVIDNDVKYTERRMPNKFREYRDLWEQKLKLN